MLQFHVPDFVERAHGQLGCVEIEQCNIELVSTERAAIGKTIESLVAKDFGDDLRRRITGNIVVARHGFAEGPGDVAPDRLGPLLGRGFALDIDRMPFRALGAVDDPQWPSRL